MNSLYQITMDNAHYRILMIFSLLILAIVSLLKFNLIYSLNINWDEFYVLSRAFQFYQGLPHNNESNEAGKSAIYLFLFWLDNKGNDMDEIVSARLLIFLLHFIALFFLYRISERAFNKQIALISVLAFVCYSYYIMHGFSLRYDNLAIVFVLGAIYLYKSGNSVFALVSQAILFGVAIAITIKSLIYFSLLMALIISCNNDFSSIRREALRLALVLAGAILVHLAIASQLDVYLQSSDPYLRAGADEVGADLLDSKRFLGGNDIAVTMTYFKDTLKDDWLIWILALSSFMGALVVSIKGKQLKPVMIVVFALLPLCLGVLLYRNMYPYFYVMLIPMVIFSAAQGLYLLCASLDSKKQLVVFMVIAVLMSANGFYHLQLHGKDSITRQRQLTETIYNMFPEPVAYVDKCSMLPKYFKTGYFMSSAGREGYRHNKVPVIANAIEHNAAANKPLFVITNNPQLQYVFKDGSKVVDLFHKDQQALRDNYIHHWDLIYVAGKELKFEQDKTPRKLTFPIQGPYTLESTQPVLVDGRAYPPGHVLNIQKDVIFVAPTHKFQKITFRWGDHIYKPDFEPARQPIFTGLAVLGT